MAVKLHAKCNVHVVSKKWQLYESSSFTACLQLLLEISWNL